MKAHRFLTVAVLLITALIAIINGCKYDVAEPAWDKPYTPPQSPVINQVTPAQATAGVNLITISGENFGVPPNDSTIVYFDKLTAEIVTSSSTSITVRRPNMVSDSCTIKVVSNKAYVVAKKSPYKITSVQDKYGSFLDNVILSVIAVDKTENIYVGYGDSLTARIFKVSPDGQKELFSRSRRVPTDAKVGPDGNLYLLCSNREIDKVDMTTRTTTNWHRLATNKQLRCGDFDAEGNLYAGGNKTDLWVIKKDSTSSDSKAYAQDTIYTVKVYNGFVYVAGKKASGQKAIWKHSIGTGGSLGAQELVFEFTGEYASRPIRTIYFASDGNMFIGTNSPNPLLTANTATGQMDLFYKDILPPYCKQFYWGNGNSIYMLSGNSAPAQEWTVYKVDMGITAAP